MKDNAEKMRKLIDMLALAPNGLPLSAVERECREGHFTLTELTFSFAIYEYQHKENGKNKVFIKLCDFYNNDKKNLLMEM